MDCPHVEWIHDIEVLRAVVRKAVAQRVPLSGTFELTRRCNLRCVHCYLGSQEGQGELRHDELSTAQAVAIIDQVAEAGCLFLLITGGDPLLRPDFPEIYRHSREAGLLTTVFTNGTLISEKIIHLFRDFPPRSVEITLYGASAETYERITGQVGSYGRCLAGIDSLLAAGIPLRLKTLLLSHNAAELPAIKAMARQRDVPFRFDPMIFAAVDGGQDPLALRLGAKEAVDAEFADPDRARAWREYFLRAGRAPASDAVFQCAAARTSFDIDPFGNLQACALLPPSYSLLEVPFPVAWQKLGEIRNKRARADNPCPSCENRAICNYCPGFFEVETGDQELRSYYACATGQYRRQILTHP